MNDDILVKLTRRQSLASIIIRTLCVYRHGVGGDGCKNESEGTIFFTGWTFLCDRLRFIGVVPLISGRGIRKFFGALCARFHNPSKSKILDLPL